MGRVARPAVAAVLAAGLVALAGVAAAGSSGAAWGVLVGPDFIRYIPGTGEWTLGLQVVGEGWAGTPPSLAGVRVSLDGQPLPGSRFSFQEAPWIRAAGRVTEAEAREVEATRAAELRGQPPAAADLPRLEGAAGRLAALLEEAPGACLTLTGTASVAEGIHWIGVTVDYRLGGAPVSLAEEIEVIVATVPRDTGWFCGDFHMHSTYSDGDEAPAQLKTDLQSHGYYMGYVTDHTDLLMSAGSFDNMSDTYPSACKSCSDTTTSMFPGVEMTVGYWDGDFWYTQGDCLGYGVASTSGLDNKLWNAQTGIDKVNQNNGSYSTAAIAHPVSLTIPWTDWTVLRYYGIELMSGKQSYYDLNSSPVVKWRDECARLQSYGASFRPSVRTGSDRHGTWYWYYTHVRLPSDSAWTGGTWEQRRAAVDTALMNGRTTCSHLGSLAYIRADGNDVGSSLTRSTGVSMSFSIYFKPALSGTYTLALYRDNCANTVWSQPASSYTANTAYTWTQAYGYPGGSHYYWLYVSGPDYAYTTPIYVHQ